MTRNCKTSYSPTNEIIIQIDPRLTTIIISACSFWFARFHIIWSCAKPKRMHHSTTIRPSSVDCFVFPGSESFPIAARNNLSVSGAVRPHWIDSFFFLYAHVLHKRFFLSHVHSVTLVFLSISWSIYFYICSFYAQFRFINLIIELYRGAPFYFLSHSSS